MSVTGGLTLAIRLRFHNHAPEQRARWLALHQQAADELGGNLLGGAGEEGLGEGWEVLGKSGGYGRGLGGDGWRLLGGGWNMQRLHRRETPRVATASRSLVATALHH
jgi:hypothetical protein